MDEFEKIRERWRNLDLADWTVDTQQAKQDLQWLIKEVTRLSYVVGWVEENAAFDDDGWERWAAIESSPEPWKIDGND